MAWFSGKVNLGGLDLAGAVNKLQESVKNIEKNFDSALGLEDKSDSTSSSSASASVSTEASGLWPVISFMGHKNEDRRAESAGKHGSPQKSSESSETDGSPQKSTEPLGKDESPQESSGPLGKDGSPQKLIEEKETLSPAAEQTEVGELTKSELKEPQGSADERCNVEEKNEVARLEDRDEHPEIAGETDEISQPVKAEFESESVLSPMESHKEVVPDALALESVDHPQEKDIQEVTHAESSESVEAEPEAEKEDQTVDANVVYEESNDGIEIPESTGEQKATLKESLEESVPPEVDVSRDPHNGVSTENQAGDGTSALKLDSVEENDHRAHEFPIPTFTQADEASEMVSESVSLENAANLNVVEEDGQVHNASMGDKEQHPSSGSIASDSKDYVIELEKLKVEMRTMEAALQGAARQAQAKADEIAKLMNENEHLRAAVEDLKRKSNNDAEIESLREEYHQRVATLERKVYALTKERDALRREQSKKSDAAALLKEKDEIITQVMAEGEELSKKQAAQESTIRKLRAQIRELEEEKKGLTTKLQVEENKVESIKKDKTETEKLLQETIEKHQTELAAQKEYYTNALTAAKEAEALAEARVNNEARSELESRLREAEVRESMLVQALEELRQTLSRKEQQAVFREDMLRKDIEDLQRRYQASERRCEELITQVPESTRPLLRQIEAMQETAARRAEAWAAVERSLNSRLQEAEAKAAAAEERERSVNERLSQTLSRINVLEAQISCLRAEQTQLSKSLEKERQRAAENRQEYLAAKEEADTQEGRANQLEQEIKEHRQKHKQELQDAQVHRELLQQEVEREKAARLDLEKTSRSQSTAAPDQTSLARSTSTFENGNLSRKLSTASSLGSMEESYFLQASLDTSDSFLDRRNPGEATMSPYFMKSMTPSAFESALRQKEGELASYMSRLASMESIRDSLAEELVSMTAQCEKLRAESALLPGIRAELEALRRRHSAALELMGERDEELEELRADIVDLKEMYREQVNLLVNKIQTMSSSSGNA